MWRWAVCLIAWVASARAAGVVELGLGASHSCARLDDGAVWCWGDNGYGQLGDGTTRDSAVPVRVRGLDGAVELAVGGHHACARRRDGSVRCWGWDHRGQLGAPAAGVCKTRVVSSSGGAAEFDEPCSPAPVAVAGLDGVTALAAGGTHTCALGADGGVRCWGDNLFLQLGDDTRVSRAAPARVPGLDDVDAIALGDQHGCARSRSGGVRCWGGNTFGQLGDGTRFDHAAPAPVVGLAHARAIGLGYTHSCALVDGGGVRCWGNNSDGQLGDGTTTHRARPVEVAGLEHAAAIAVGTNHACALGAGGDVRCWGSDERGQLGDGAAGFHRWVTRPAPPIVELRAAGIAAGGSHTCARGSGGGCWCWGGNPFGQLGDGTTTMRVRPVAITVGAQR